MLTLTLVLLGKIMVGLSKEAPPVAWADEWLPPEVWQLEAREANLYYDQKMAAMKAAGKAPGSEEQAVERHGGFTPLSCKAFYCCELILYGIHGIQFNRKETWGEDLLTANSYIAARMPRNYYLAHAKLTRPPFARLPCAMFHRALQHPSHAVLRMCAVSPCWSPPSAGPVALWAACAAHRAVIRSRANTGVESHWVPPGGGIRVAVHVAVQVQPDFQPDPTCPHA